VVSKVPLVRTGRAVGEVDLGNQEGRARRRVQTMEEPGGKVGRGEVLRRGTDGEEQRRIEFADQYSGDGEEQEDAASETVQRKGRYGIFDLSPTKSQQKNVVARNANKWRKVDGKLITNAIIEKWCFELSSI
jgi:hypothetical protein